MTDLAKLRDLLRAAVRERAEDGAGVVLSGGVDSSTVSCLADRELPTFTGYYCELGFDERHYARLAAGREHHEVLIQPRDFVENFDAMMAAARPPFQGPGMFGQYMVAKYAAEHVDVVLSGEGSDELFGGYARLMMVAGANPPLGYQTYSPPAGYPTTVPEALAYDYDRLDDLLAVDDQMCGAWGLESRAPFTDDRVVEFALALDPFARVGKVVLKSAMRGIVPDRILDRRDKMGFPVPLVRWAQAEPVRSFIKERLGWVPHRGMPYDRAWWSQLCEKTHEAATA
jgi:asparagine synthetase B (glutamine-hydrolysing)